MNNSGLLQFHILMKTKNRDKQQSLFLSQQLICRISLSKEKIILFTDVSW